MYPSPSGLPEAARTKVSAALDAVLADGLDLHGQVKVAHWNIKGPYFATLHPLFEQIAIALAAFNDTLAERAVTLGALVHGTAAHIAQTSRLPKYKAETVRDLDLVGVLADAIDGYLAGVRAARTVAEGAGDTDSVDLLTQVATDFEKHGWFLRATLAR